MLARIILTALFAAAPLTVQGMTQSVAQSGADTDITFVSLTATDIADQNAAQYADIRVLRNFAATTSLGKDPETGTDIYPHRSVALTYKVDCDANRLAVSQWQMYAGTSATGKIVWDQQNTGRLGFIDAVNAEMRAVMRTACPTNTVSRW